jgi:hypothetical protein
VTATPGGASGLRPAGLFLVSAATFLLTVYGSRLLVSAAPGQRVALAAVGLALAGLGVACALTALRRLFAGRSAQGSLAGVALLAAALIALNASGALMALITLMEQLARAA